MSIHLAACETSERTHTNAVPATNKTGRKLCTYHSHCTCLRLLFFEYQKDEYQIFLPLFLCVFFFFLFYIYLLLSSPLRFIIIVFVFDFFVSQVIAFEVLSAELFSLWELFIGIQINRTHNNLNQMAHIIACFSFFFFVRCVCVMWGERTGYIYFVVYDGFTFI